MNELITYTVYHTETGKVVAKNLFEASLVHLINKMIKEDIVKDIELSDYIISNGDIAILSLTKYIESQGVFIFQRKIHG